ncbi:MAG TPA: hypothetical protein VFS64_01720 [Solirubrobacterales bacterium]|nr:hypothetical protein [Solirubrobacterales bacterium]
MKRLLFAGALLLAMLLPVSASAAVHHPTGEYTQFAYCPLESPNLGSCLYSESTAGSFTIGKKTVPLKNPVVLQGGLDEEPTVNTTLIPAEEGNTLPPVAQPVPGGLLGIEAPSWWPKFLRDLFNETINNGFTGVTATVELAGQPVDVNALNLLFEKGTAITLPTKIKLSNPFLGNNCHIGSNSNPVVFKFTSGTTSPPPPNEPIKGSRGTISSNPSGTIETISGGRLVDNSFAAPGANGCGGLLSLLIDPFVNSIVGVPAPAGTNTAILEGKIQLAVPEAVKASE